MPMPSWLRILMGLPAPQETAPTTEDQAATDDETAADTTPSTRAQMAPWQLGEAPPPPGRWQKIVRGVVTIAVLLFAFLGVRGVLLTGEPTEATQVELPLTATFPEAAAAGAALRFAPAWASWDAEHPEARREALAPLWAGDHTVGWNGKGHQTATNPTVASVRIIDAHTAAVTVVMQVSSWDRDQNSGDRVNQRSTVEAVEVTVRVRPDGQAAVIGLPVYVANPAKGTADPVALPSQDSALTEATRTYATAFWTAYARDADLSAITAPGSTVAGLGGSATFHQLSSWQVAATDSDTTKAQATVELAHPDGAVTTHVYQLTLQRTASGTSARWQVLTLN